MAKKRQDFIDKITRLVRDKDEQLDADDAGDALDSAVLTYSRHRPKYVVQEYPGTGTRLFALPTNWVEHFSDEDFKVEYPLDDTAVQPQFLDKRMCEPYLTPTGTQLRFKGTVNTNFVPSATEKFRVHYSVPRTLTDATNEIPDPHFDPVCWLAAHYLCGTLAIRYSQQSDQLGPGTLADFKNKADNFSRRASELWERYKKVILPEKSDVRPAFRMTEFETTPLHREERPEYPTDNSGRLYTDV